MQPGDALCKPAVLVVTGLSLGTNQNIEGISNLSQPDSTIQILLNLNQLFLIQCLTKDLVLFIVKVSNSSESASLDDTSHIFPMRFTHRSIRKQCDAIGTRLHSKLKRFGYLYFVQFRNKDSAVQGCGFG